VENVLDILCSGNDSGQHGLGISSTDQITPEHLIIPTDFHCALGAGR
jgi:pre-mycofactocin synthase